MDRVTLSAPAEDDFHTLLRLVVGGVGSRSGLSYEQTSDLQLAVETLVSNRATLGGTVVLEAGIESAAGTVSLRMGPFAASGGAGERRALDRLVDEVQVHHYGDDGGDWFELTVGSARAEGGT